MHPIVTERVTWSASRSVGLSVCHDREPCKNGGTDRDAVWVVNLGGPKEPRSAKMLLKWSVRPRVRAF